MALFNPHFEVRPSLITGDTVDLYLHRSLRILRSEGLNPVVVMDFVASEAGILCGTQEVKAVLGRVTSEGNREVWSIEEGEEIAANELCLMIRAPYSSFGLYETAICGILGNSSGWATAARALVNSASGIPVISAGAHNVHPSVASIMDYAAVVGGCAGCTTVLGTKLAGTQPTTTIPTALVRILGDSLKAVTAFDRIVAPDVPRIAYLEPKGDLAAQAMDLARALKERLSGVRLSIVPGGSPVTAEVIKDLRKHLDDSGHRHVEIVLSGELPPTYVKELLASSAPVDALHDTGYITQANPLPFRALIRSVSDRPVPQEEEHLPQANPRMVRLL